MERNLVEMGQVEFWGKGRDGGQNVVGLDGQKVDVNVPGHMRRMES